MSNVPTSKGGCPTTSTVTVLASFCQWQLQQLHPVPSLSALLNLRCHAITVAMSMSALLPAVLQDRVHKYQQSSSLDRSRVSCEYISCLYGHKGHAWPCGEGGIFPPNTVTTGPPS